MDIHAPDKPVHSWREFAVHIAIVTVGILIALGFDGIREHFRERRLIRETRESFRYEMKADQEHMRQEMERVRSFRDALKAINGGLPANLATQPEKVRSLVDAQFNPGYFFAANAWQTALSTGALAHMKTEEVAAYAYAAQGVSKYTLLQAEAQQQEAVTKADLAAHPHPAGDALATSMEDLLLLANAEEALTFVGPQVEADIDRALRATGPE